MIVVALAAVTLTPAFGEDAKYQSTLSVSRQTGPSGAGGELAEIPLLAWSWAQSAPPTWDFVAGAPPLGAPVAHATPLGFVLPDGTKITAKTSPEPFRCILAGDGGADLINAARRGAKIPAATIALRHASGGRQGIATIRLSGVRIASVTVYGPGCGPRQGLIGVPSSSPIQVIALACDAANLQRGQTNPGR